MSIEIKSLELTINNVTYRATNVQKVSLSVSKRRLILSLYRPYHDTPNVSEEEIGHSYNVAMSRAKALKTVFAQVFPDATKFSEATRNFAEFGEQIFVLRNAQDEHIRWAKMAKECSLIDGYLADYDLE